MTLPSQSFAVSCITKSVRNELLDDTWDVITIESINAHESAGCSWKELSEDVISPPRRRRLLLSAAILSEL